MKISKTKGVCSDNRAVGVRDRGAVDNTSRCQDQRTDNKTSAMWMEGQGGSKNTTGSYKNDIWVQNALWS